MSDLNSFALVSGTPENLDLSWTGSVAQSLYARPPCVTGVDLGCVGLDEIGSMERFSELDLLMVTQTACVCGEDLIPGLPRYKPGILVANSDIISQIRADIGEAIVELETDPGSTRYWCHRVAKNIVRTGFSLLRSGLLMRKTGDRQGTELSE